jgi:hypothetical protein
MKNWLNVKENAEKRVRENGKGVELTADNEKILCN